MRWSNRRVKAKPGHPLAEQPVDSMAVAFGLVREGLALPRKQTRAREPIEKFLDVRLLDERHGEHAADELAVEVLELGRAGPAVQLHEIVGADRGQVVETKPHELRGF